MRLQDELLTLTRAAKVAPGRPSTNCMWRWCRRGVLARSGVRVKLQHVRVGGKLYTTKRWLDEFGRRLAEADAEYFDESATAGQSAHGRRQDSARPSGASARVDVERELQEAGL